MRHPFSVVGSALVATSLVIALGFAVLSCSRFRVTAYLGMLTALTVLAALAVDVLLLPPILLWLDGGEERSAGRVAVHPRTDTVQVEVEAAE